MENFKCKLCEKEYNSYNSLAKHSSRTHKIKGEELYMLHNNITEHPKCKCGCGEETRFFGGKGGWFGEYIQGHHTRVNGGFYSPEGARKSGETRKKRLASGEISVWNKGKKYSDKYMAIYSKSWSDPERLEKIKLKNRENAVTKLGYDNWDEWYNSLSDRDKYYYDARQLTEKNAHLIEGYDKSSRGRCGVKGAYQIDHIIPLSRGFLENIPIEDIAHQDNLQFIPWKQNLQKGSK